MKRTTYIMIGMLVTGVAMVCGLMFYVVDRNVTQKDNFMEIGGERKTVQLPSCRVLKLTQPPVPPFNSYLQNSIWLSMEMLSFLSTDCLA